MRRPTFRWHDFVARPEDDRREHAQGDVVFKPKSMPGLKLPLAKAWAKVPKE